jgi:hypothetical protein
MIEKKKSTKSAEINIVLCPATAAAPRHTEASMLAFPNGRLLLAYSEFYAGGGLDADKARIAGRWSKDEGTTWGEPFVLQENIGKLNCMSASFAQLPTGRILLAFGRKDAEPTLLHAMLKYSDDEGKTWSQPKGITRGDIYWCITNDRLVRLSSGRLLYPVESGGEREACVWYSDDDGATWAKSTKNITAPEGIYYAEPTVVELPAVQKKKREEETEETRGQDALGTRGRDARDTQGRDALATQGATVAMYVRTTAGNIHIALSKDGGDTWEMYKNAKPDMAGRPDTGPNAAYSPCMVKRVPGGDDLLLVWNNNRTRTPLTAAISSDSGETWRHFRNLEEMDGWPPRRSHTYPSITFFKDHVHLTYWEAEKQPSGQYYVSLKYRRLPLAWFYEKP